MIYIPSVTAYMPSVTVYMLSMTAHMPNVMVWLGYKCPGPWHLLKASSLTQCSNRRPLHNEGITGALFASVQCPANGLKVNHVIER